MLLVPSVSASHLTRARAAQAGHGGRYQRLGALNVLAHGLAEAVIERQRRTTLALTITRLPDGWCVIDRDAAGCERYIGPVAAAPAYASAAALR